jgi:hypothetical protein
MQTRLVMCATYLQEIDGKLEVLLASLENDLEKGKALEALSFVRMARRAISETRARLNSLPPEKGIATDRTND